MRMLQAHTRACDIIDHRFHFDAFSTVDTDTIVSVYAFFVLIHFEVRYR